MFFAFTIVLSIITSIIDSIIGYQIFGGLTSLALIVPTLAIGVRRLHDANKSGWFYLLIVIPIVNFYLLYLLLFCDSHATTNKWGDNPKAGE